MNDDKINKAYMAVAVAFAMIFLTPILGVLLGALSGFMVSIVFDDPVRNIIVGFFPALEPYSLTQIGMAFGFLGGFFRVTQTSKS